MARLNETFDATAHDTTQSDYSELPNGIYRLEVEASDVVDTKAGTGKMLKTTMSVLEPEEYKGRKLFTSYNLQNVSADAEAIGKRQFASLCRAIGAEAVDDSEDLHLRGFTAKVGLGKPSKDGQYPARAEIKRYYFEDEGKLPEPAIDAVQPVVAKPANDNRPAANDNRPAAKPAPARAAGSKPWANKK
jgi:hypothetical protein